MPFHHFQNDEAGFGEFPWTVAILQNIGVAVSAGSLIHPKIVLTVYHHVKKYEFKSTETVHWMSKKNLELISLAMNHLLWFLKQV